MQLNTDKKSLLPHLFLLRVLPSEESPDLKQHEFVLLKLFSNFLQKRDLQRVPELRIARQAFTEWANIQSTGSIIPKKLSEAINKLKASGSSGHLPLFIREQNSGLLISIPTFAPLPDDETAECDRNITSAAADTSTKSNCLSENQTAVISSFPASLPTTKVMTVTTPTFIYPTTSVRVTYSSLLKSECLAEMIAHLNETKQPYATELNNTSDGKSFECIGEIMNYVNMSISSELKNALDAESKISVDSKSSDDNQVLKIVYLLINMYRCMRQ
jgi:hypothetical protein